MRQAGILAAAGIHALEHHVDRLGDDHNRAQSLAEGIRAAGYTVPEPPTNMLYVDVRDGPAAQEALEAKGARCLAVSDSILRLVTHLDVDDAGVEHVIEAFKALSDTQATA